MGRTRYVSRCDLRIAYELRGTLHRRRPWLVLIQGMGLDRSGWQPVLRKLRRHFRLVLVDNRASGLSDRPSRRFTVADMAGDVGAVLDAARVGRPHVLGASLGGMVAQELAVHYLERVDGLVLACTTPGWPFAYPMPGATVRLAYPMPGATVRLMAATTGLTAEASMRRHTDNALSARTVQQHPELLDRLVDLQRVRPTDPGAPPAQAAAGVLYAGGLRQRRIGARMLLQGAADTVVDPRNARLVAARIPGATWATAGAACWSPGSGPARPWPTTAPTAKPGSWTPSVFRQPTPPGTRGNPSPPPTPTTWTTPSGCSTSSPTASDGKTH